MTTFEKQIQKLQQENISLKLGLLPRVKLQQSTVLSPVEATSTSTFFMPAFAIIPVMVAILAIICQ